MKRAIDRLWFKCVAILLAIIMVSSSNCSAVFHDDRNNPGPKIIAQVCVVIIVGIFVGYGACAAKKIIDKIPPPNPPPPPPPRPGTNAPPSSSTLIVQQLVAGDGLGRTNEIACTMPPVSVDGAGNGMQGWFISSNSHVAANPSLYSDPEGHPYTHIYVTSIQSRTNTGSSWKTVGSRMLWLNTNFVFTPSTATVVFYNGQGVPVMTNYVPSAQYMNPYTLDTTNSSVKLMDWEIIPGASQQQFRLAGCTNSIKILIEP